jgi:hypothetical protein
VTFAEDSYPYNDFQSDNEEEVHDEVQMERRPPPNRRIKDEFYNPPREERFPEDERKGHHYFDDYDDYNEYHTMKKKFNNIQILDLILYVVSGIILIFLMEQFVRIGINMQ